MKLWQFWPYFAIIVGNLKRLGIKSGSITLAHVCKAVKLNGNLSKLYLDVNQTKMKGIQSPYFWKRLKAERSSVSIHFNRGDIRSWVQKQQLKRNTLWPNLCLSTILPQAAKLRLIFFRKICLVASQKRGELLRDETWIKAHFQVTLRQ